MFVEEIPDNVKTTTHVVIRYDCNGGFERCGRLWTLKYRDAQQNFEKNQGKHVCRQCGLKNNNPASRKEVRDKMKKTSLEKYGVTCPMNTKENTKKRVDKMFGTKESTKEIVEKRKNTSLERYGTESPIQNEEIKKRQQNTLMKKYGVIAPLQNPEILAKAKKTNMERYGVDNVCQVPEVRIKMAKTTLERYGVEHYNQLPEMKDYLRENCKEWLKESYENPWAKGTIRPEEWNQRQRETVVNLIIAGKWFGGYGKGKVQGWYTAKKCIRKRSYFRSALELLVHCHLDLTDEQVDFYDYEPFHIPYVADDGSNHSYIIDFIIKYKDQDRLYMIEVKPNFKFIDPKVIIKSEAGYRLAEEENLIFELWDEKYICQFPIKKEQAYVLENVEMRKD